MVLRRPLRVGAAVLAAYVAVAVGTIALTGRHVRPLYESIGPEGPYHWVHPPPLFAPSNTKPGVHHQRVPVAGDTSVVQAGTSDGQVFINVPPNDLTPPPGTTATDFVFTPLDPAKLGPLPGKLTAVGNVYQITYSFLPSGTPGGPLKTAGNVVLTLPEPITTLAYSPDGKSWTLLPGQQVGSPLTEGATFKAPGYFVGATDNPPPALNMGGSQSTFPTVVVAVIAVAVALILVIVPMLILRRRRKPAPAPPPNKPKANRPEANRPNAHKPKQGKPKQR